MNNVRLNINTEIDPHLTSMLGEVDQLLNDAELPAALAEAAQLFLESEKVSKSLVVLDSAQVDDAATGTSQLVIRAKPGDGLLVLLTALRTRNGDGLVVEKTHIKDLLLVGAAVDLHPHHTSQQEAPIKLEGE